MKKYFNFTLLTLAALLFTGCSNEEEITNGGTPDIKGGITFTFPAPKAGTTYATTPGIGFENDVDLANTTILMFDDGAGSTPADPKLEAIYSGADIIAGTVGTNKTATVVMPTTGLTAGLKIFRFVVNTQSATAALATLQVGDHLSTIKDIITEDQPAAGLAKGKLLMGGTSAAINIGTVVNGGKITLKRRVARFDIQNDMAARVQIKRVEVYGSKKNGYVLATNAYAVTTAATDKLSFSDAAPATIIDLTAANTVAPGLESAFYLYPSSDATTTIQLTVVVNGNTEVLTVPARIIAANTRYILKPSMLPDGKIGFELAVAPWDDATEIATAEAGNPVVSGFTSTTNGGGTLNAEALTYEVTNSTAATVITFNTLAATNAGVNLSVVAEMGDLGVTTTSTAVGALTYAAGYPQTHTIKIPAYTGGAADIFNKVIITDRAAAVDATGTTITLWSNGTTGSKFYPGTTLEPVVVGSITWAPVNVGGATTVDATVFNQASVGKVYQWGRGNIGWVVGNQNGITHSDVISGPVSLADANGLYSTKFILNNGGDWLDTQDDNLWSGVNTQGPCPAGWRLPTSAELTTIKTAYRKANFDEVRHRLAIPGTVAGKTLYFPIGGARGSGTGATSWPGGAGNYWTSTISGSKVYSIYISNQGADMNLNPRAAGFNVRCVKAN